MEDKNTRTVAAQVEEELYWKFKKMVVARKESMQDALVHAIMLYLDMEVPDEQ